MIQKNKNKSHHHLHSFLKQHSHLNKLFSISNTVPEKFVALQKTLSLGNTKNFGQRKRSKLGFGDDLLIKNFNSQEKYVNDLMKMYEGDSEWNKQFESKSKQLIEEEQTKRKTSSKRILHSSECISRDKKEWKAIPKLLDIIQEHKKYKKLSRFQLVDPEKVGVQRFYKNKKNRKREERVLQSIIHPNKEEETREKILMKVHKRNKIVKQNEDLEEEVTELKERAIKEFGVKFQNNYEILANETETQQFAADFKFEQRLKENKERYKTFYEEKNQKKTGFASHHDASVPRKYMQQIKGRFSKNNFQIFRKKSKIRYVKL